MKPLATQEAANWDYAIDEVAPKANPMGKGSVKGSHPNSLCLTPSIDKQAVAKHLTQNW